MSIFEQIENTVQKETPYRAAKFIATDILADKKATAPIKKAITTAYDRGCTDTINRLTDGCTYLVNVCQDSSDMNLYFSSYHLAILFVWEQLNMFTLYNPNGTIEQSGDFWKTIIHIDGYETDRGDDIDEYEVVVSYDIRENK